MTVDSEPALESYFEFHDDGAHLWIANHRVGIDLLLEAYKAGQTPEQIAEGVRHHQARRRSPPTITYYLRHKTCLDGGSLRSTSDSNGARRRVCSNPSPTSERLRATCGNMSGRTYEGLRFLPMTRLEGALTSNSSTAHSNIDICACW